MTCTLITYVSLKGRKCVIPFLQCEWNKGLLSVAYTALQRTSNFGERYKQYMCYVCMVVGVLPKSMLEDLSSFISVVHTFLLCFTTWGGGGCHTYSRGNSLLYSVRPHSVRTAVSPRLFLPDRSQNRFPSAI